jgi:hypothetical protein
MSTRWRIRIAFVATVLAAAALSVGMVATAHSHSTKSHLSARAQFLAKTNPLVISQTKTTRVVRAVVGDKLFVIMFEKRGDVWFFAASKPASELAG